MRTEPPNKMVDVEGFLDQVQNYIEGRLLEEGEKYYQMRPTADPDYYDAVETAEKAMNHITVNGREKDLVFGREEMVRRNNAEMGIRNKASKVESIVRELNDEE